MSEYNPFKDFNPVFTQYLHLEVPLELFQLTVKDPILGEFQLPKGFMQSSNGNYIAPPNTPETQQNFNFSEMMDNMAKTHSELNPQQEYTSSTKSIVKYNLSGNKKKAMEFFLTKGLSANLAAGIVGNLMGESGLNSEAINPTSKAYGIALWLGSRKRRLFNIYGSKPTFDQLLEFLWDELNTTEKSAFDRLLLTSSVEEATNSFMKHFERPSLREMVQSISKRIKYGKELLQ